MFARPAMLRPRMTRLLLLRELLARLRQALLAILMVWALSHASVFGQPIEPLPDTPTASERIRKALDQTMGLDFSSASIHEVIEHLKEKLRVNIIVDQVALQQVGLGLDDGGPGVMLHLKSDRTSKVRTALQRMLSACNLTYFILEDALLISTEDIGLQRQMRQRVSVNLKDVPASRALKNLARQTGLNLVIDPRHVKEADTKVTLQVDDATVETVVRLVAEMGNLKAVRLGNVLFITNESRADKLRREEPPIVVPTALLR